jgi:hypothetical protein
MTVAMLTMNHPLYSIDADFHDPPDTPHRQIISASNLNKRDATFSTTKRLLGWDVDIYTMTLASPLQHLDSLAKLIASYLPEQHTSKCRWHQFLGKLCSMTPALYVANHLFSILQHNLIAAPRPYICFTLLIESTIMVWLMLANVAASQTVPLHTMVPSQPASIATTEHSLSLAIPVSSSTME